MCDGSLVSGVIVSRPFCWAFAAASVQPLTIAHCFKTLGSDRFDGLLVCWVFVVWFLFYSVPLLKCLLARWLLAVGCLAFLQTYLRFLVPEVVISHACCLHFRILGNSGTTLRARHFASFAILVASGSTRKDTLRSSLGLVSKGPILEALWVPCTKKSVRIILSYLFEFFFFG